MKKLTDKQVHTAVAGTIDKSGKQVKGLVSKYGVPLASNAKKSDVDKAVTALIKKSKAFRKDFSTLATRTAWSGFAGQEISLDDVYAGADGFRDFAGQQISLDDVFTGADGFRDFAGQEISLDDVFAGFAGQKVSLDDVFAGAAGGGATGSATDPLLNSTKTKTKTGGGLGKYFTPEAFQSVLNTGLNIWAAKMGTTAAGANQIDDARTNTTTDTTPAKGGMSVGTIALIGVGLVAIVGAVWYFNKKK